jgi:hypothetical protein
LLKTRMRAHEGLASSSLARDDGSGLKSVTFDY